MKNIIKRNGESVIFDSEKIVSAITGANMDVGIEDRVCKADVNKIANSVEEWVMGSKRLITVEEIQDYVEDELLKVNTKVAKKYIKYREQRKAVRDDGRLMESIRSINNSTNKVVGKENSNKNADLLSTKRDLIAGEAIKEIMRTDMMTPEILDAHNKGAIHSHDMDYSAMEMYNCSLVNLEDMLQNGTVVGHTKIDRPKSFSVACNVATQIIAQVASSQYGGQSISLSHIAPFVDVSRQKYRQDVKNEFAELGIEITEDDISKLAEKRVLKEIKDGVQTIQYQINTLMTSNGGPKVFSRCKN